MKLQTKALLIFSAMAVIGVNSAQSQTSFQENNGLEPLEYIAPSPLVILKPSPEAIQPIYTKWPVSEEMTDLMIAVEEVHRQVTALNEYRASINACSSLPLMTSLAGFKENASHEVLDHYFALKNFQLQVNVEVNRFESKLGECLPEQEEQNYSHQSGFFEMLRTASKALGF